MVRVYELYHIEKVSTNLIHFYILLLIAAVLVWLSSRLFLKYQKAPAITYLSFLFLALAVLATITGIIGISTNDGNVLVLTRLGYLFGVAVFSMMLMTSWYFPVPSPNLLRRTELFWIVPVAFFLPLTVLSSSLVQGIERFNGNVKEVAGPAFFLFPLLVAVYFILSLVNLIKKLGTVQGEQRKHLQLIIAGLCLGAGSAVIFDGVLPFFNFPARHYVSIELASVFIGSSVFIMTRK